MARPSKYNLRDINVGSSREYEGLSKPEQAAIRRAAHNLNLRTALYFITRVKDDVLVITRVA